MNTHKDEIILSPMILLLIADGRSIHTQRWAEYFAERGHEVHLITYDPMDRIIPGVTEHVLISSDGTISTLRSSPAILQ